MRKKGGGENGGNEDWWVRRPGLSPGKKDGVGRVFRAGFRGLSG